MLLRFSVSNHLSIKETQELSFIKSALKGSEEGLLSTPALPKDMVLPAAVIYGPNASGKTNLLDALSFMRSAVLVSQSRWAPDEGVPRRPFLLCNAVTETPSRFEMDFDLEGVRYNYGFACTSSEFREEWLYEAPFGRQRMIFERNGPLPENFKFGSSFTGQKQAIAQLMRPNSLFLSAAFQNNHPLAKAVVSIFQKILTQKSLSTEAGMLSRILKKGDVDSRIMSFLAEIGTGITDYRKVIKEQTDEVTRTVRGMFEVMWNELDVKPTEDERKSILTDVAKDVKIEFSHKSEDGRDVFLNASHESAGTRRLIPLLQNVMLALDQGNVCVIDEIDASLHTLVCDAIIALFTNRATNPNGAQIIATTHDTNLFNTPNLRRDELWLVEKTFGGASEFYSLADVKVREAGTYERGYLQGRYGAIPFAGSATDLIQRL